MTGFPRASKPLRIKGVIIPNRIVFPPFVTNYSARDGSISEKQIEFYRRIAAAGVGLTIIGASGATPDRMASGMTRIDDDR